MTTFMTASGSRPGAIPVAALALALYAPAQAAWGRDYVSIAGSSTILPFAAAVAEAFGQNNPGYKTPVVESGGSSAGLKLFCAGVGQDTIDIANASRPIKAKEVASCHENGVDGIIELTIGYDGIVFASHTSSAPYHLRLEDIYLALGARVPVNGKLAANPYDNWRQINPSYPDQPIRVFIPGEKHGTRDVFESKSLAVGCAKVLDAAAIPLDKAARKNLCKSVRKDGRSVDIDGDYTVTLARITQEPGSLGVFGFSFYDLNRDRVRITTVDGMSGSFEAIADGSWPLSRPLFIYVKKNHLPLTPGLEAFARYFLSDPVTGEEGFTSDLGLIPAPPDQRRATQRRLEERVTLN